MKKQKIKTIDKAYFYVVSFYFAFLPAFGLFFISGFVTSGILTLIFNDVVFVTPVILTIVYVLLTVFTLVFAAKGANLYRRNFVISALLILLWYFFVVK